MPPREQRQRSRNVTNEQQSEANPRRVGKPQPSRSTRKLLSPRTIRGSAGPDYRILGMRKLAVSQIGAADPTLSGATLPVADQSRQGPAVAPSGVEQPRPAAHAVSTTIGGVAGRVGMTGRVRKRASSSPFRAPDRCPKAWKGAVGAH